MFNYNYNKIVNPTFTDKLPVSQKVLEDSIELYELNIKGNGEISQKGDALVEGVDYNVTFNEGKNEFQVVLLKPKEEEKVTINNPYQIVYKSNIVDDYYPPNKGNYSIKNKAELKGDNGIGCSWEKEVNVKHTNKLISKKFVPEKKI